MGYCNCGRKWESLSECHCSGCHEHFKSLYGFDKHRRAGKCLSNAEMMDAKMIFMSDKGYWVSGHMTDHDKLRAGKGKFKLSVDR